MNAVLLAVLIMIILSLCRLNIVLSLFIGALVGGLTAGMGLTETISHFTEGIGDGAEVALSYALLGGFAALISYSGITDYFVGRIIRLIKQDSTVKARVWTKVLIIVSLTLLSCMSQNMIPIHIAFIPIVIPPLLSLFNELKLDRRMVAVVLTFGLCFPYTLLPFGFGHIFHEIIKKGFDQAHYAIQFGDIWKAMLIPSMGFIIGLALGIFLYHKPREYRQTEVAAFQVKDISRYTVTITLLAIIMTFVVQLLTESMIFGALAGILIFFVFRVYDWKTLDDELVNGIKVMAYIGVVLLTANGFASVMNESGQVKSLVENMVTLTQGDKSLSIIFMLIAGLVITLGIGSSFATIPIIAALFIPFGQQIGLSPLALISLIGTAGALGDAGSPASDSTLGPTAGLNIDGQHDHIWDTCVPTFLLFNIPLLIFGYIAAMVL
ncbi:Na+/H+ antiporter family protein [Macrococcus carouselicus]|uniref:Na+/H+ antiporter family protein n=1 Tax=Macrococcus carouselicus TaxID=69969 RepID=A0A9Q8CH99_9STAP|nr:Na+/H+ antiporter family protein [Macrococcus carouselicus]TDM03749.1 Na+/H+ antiporter family protein [Macrococcus carouselicus]